MISVTLLVLAAPAEPLDIEWFAPEGCPAAAEVKASVERTLGSAADGERASIRAVGRVENTDAGYRLQLEVHEGDATSQRELTGATCAEVTDAAALILAMAIDPRVALSEGEPEAETAETTTEGEAETSEPKTTEVEAKTSVVARPPPPPAPRKPPRVHFVARVMAGLGLGPLPAPSASLALGLGVGGRLWRAEAVGHYWPAVEGEAPDDPSRSVSASLWSVGARGCVVPEFRRALFPVCTGVDAGSMRAEGRDLADPLVKSTPWAAIVLGAGAEWWPIRWVGLGARVDGHAAVYRPKFETTPSGLVHKAAPVGLQLLGGLLVRAP